MQNVQRKSSYSASIPKFYFTPHRDLARLSHETLDTVHKHFERSH